MGARRVRTVALAGLLVSCARAEAVPPEPPAHPAPAPPVAFVESEPAHDPIPEHSAHVEVELDFALHVALTVRPVLRESGRWSFELEWDLHPTRERLAFVPLPRFDVSARIDAPEGRSGSGGGCVYGNPRLTWLEPDAHETGRQAWTGELGPGSTLIASVRTCSYGREYERVSNSPVAELRLVIDRDNRVAELDLTPAAAE